jgi:hypothetical protein
MSERALHCYDYVNAPYARVREALTRDAVAIFQRATTAAAGRAGEIGATLRIELGPIQVGVDVKVDIRSTREEVDALGDPSTHIEFAWVAARAAGMFPSLDGTLSLLPLGAGETQIDLHARYRPPFGIVGQAIDAVAGRRVAEATLRRFVEEVSTRLRAELMSLAVE